MGHKKVDYYQTRVFELVLLFFLVYFKFVRNLYTNPFNRYHSRALRSSNELCNPRVLNISNFTITSIVFDENWFLLRIYYSDGPISIAGSQIYEYRQNTTQFVIFFVSIYYSRNYYYFFSFE